MRGEQGFTLMEMLVALAIFGVMAGFMMANFRASQRVDELRIAAEVAVTAIRQAQTRALSGAVVSQCVGGGEDGALCAGVRGSACPGGACTDIVPRGWGARFVRTGAATDAVTVFADLNGDARYDDGEGVQTLHLASAENVTASALSPAGGSLDLVFTPPRPTAFINAAQADSVAEITLTHRVTGQVRVVRFNRVSGQVGAD
jgi:prepilin-type N-terminal cleavage/methylation domain-containing protein